MIVPSVDILGGRAVQLRGGKPEGGKYPVLDLGDPELLAARLSRAGEIAVIDLDAALGSGDNQELISRIVSRYPARVGGGVRTVERALSYLDAGARAVIVGTRAEPEFLARLPASRVIAALDMKDGVVMVEGWTKAAGDPDGSRVVVPETGGAGSGGWGKAAGPAGGIEERMRSLSPYVSGFLVTFIEREGSLEGLDMDRARALVTAAGRCTLTVAGGASRPGEIAELDRLGVDVQIGTALATGELSLAQAFAAPLVSDREDGLWATVVCDEGGKALGLTWSNMESLSKALETGRGVYFSRRRGLWFKGESSGDVQTLLRVEVDCDRDALKFVVRQEGSGFCHTGRWTCFDDGSGIEKLARTIVARQKDAPAGSYTRRLFDDAALLGSKLREEADELARANGPAEAAWEAADVIYFALVRATTQGASLADIERELDMRSLRVRRRGGSAKPAYRASGEDLSWNPIH